MAPEVEEGEVRGGEGCVQRAGEWEHAEGGGLDAVDEEDAGGGGGGGGGRRGRDLVVRGFAGGCGEEFGGREERAEGGGEGGFGGAGDRGLWWPRRGAGAREDEVGWDERHCCGGGECLRWEGETDARDGVLWR